MPSIDVNAYWGPHTITLDCEGFKELADLLQTQSATQPNAQKIGPYTYTVRNGKLYWDNNDNPTKYYLDDSIGDLLSKINAVIEKEC